jgi:hypothetical protein
MSNMNMNGKYTAPPPDQQDNDGMGNDFMIDMFIDSLNPSPSAPMMDSSWDHFNGQNLVPRYPDMQMPLMHSQPWTQGIPTDQSATSASMIMSTGHNHNHNHNHHRTNGPSMPAPTPMSVPIAQNSAVTAAAAKTKRKYGLQAVDSKITRARKHASASEDLKMSQQIVLKNGKNASLFAIEKRRERNKVLARKTREKKKIEIEKLREEAANLKMENERLKEMLAKNKETMGHGDQNGAGTGPGIEGDRAGTGVVGGVEPSDAKEQGGSSKLSPSTMLSSKESDVSSGRTTGSSGQDDTSSQGSFCVLDMTSDDDSRGKTIISVSPGFVEKIGYSMEEIIGQDFHFIFGQDTDWSSVSIIRCRWMKYIMIALPSAICLHVHK